MIKHGVNQTTPVNLTFSEIVSTLNRKSISYRKFQAGNQYEFLSQTVDEANAVVRLHFITAGQPSTAALHPLFRLVNPPAVCGMACKDVKKPSVN